MICHYCHSHMIPYNTNVMIYNDIYSCIYIYTHHIAHSCTRSGYTSHCRLLASAPAHQDLVNLLVAVASVHSSSLGAHDWAHFSSYFQWSNEEIYGNGGFLKWESLFKMVIFHSCVSLPEGTPKSSIFMGCSFINNPFGGIPIYGNPQI